jgi:hypothetical protein
MLADCSPTIGKVYPINKRRKMNVDSEYFDYTAMFCTFEQRYRASPVIDVF